MQNFIKAIEKAYESDASVGSSSTIEGIFAEFKTKLNRGEIRAAEKVNDRWQVNGWVKKGVLLGFRLGKLVDYSIDARFRYFDKDTYPLKNVRLEDGIRQVPGGSSVRDGSYVAPGVVIMPPAYINVGAYVGKNTMVDSHALVGSCAQIGERVHLSAGCQIGGVLEPIGAMPVIIEDDVLVGGNSGIYDGTVVRKNAVIGAGTVLTASTPVYDLSRGQIYRKTENEPLTIPEGAVVVPGSRPASGDFAATNKISLYTPVIVKYRDARTSAATALEEALR